MLDSLKTPSPAVCYLVGAGPGDPGLMTLAGRQALETADVIVYDYLVNPEILSWARRDAERIYAGKKAGNHTLSQEEINGEIVKYALAGRTVCRLKGGDPVLFGRGAEEAASLRKAGVPFVIVPGVSSALAAPIYAGIPVTHRDHSSQLTIFTGHENPGKSESALDYAKIAAADGTKIMLMGVERIGEISRALIEHGMGAETPVALIRWGTTPRQEVLSAELGTIAARVGETGFKAPAVAVIGSVVHLREELAWWDRRPLFGKKILVTRTRDQAGELGQLLSAQGADAFEMPLIRIEGAPRPEVFEECIQFAHTYDWIVFTSPNGVDRFFEKFYATFRDARSIGGVRVAAVGPGTAKRIVENRIAVDLIPKEYTGEGLLKAFDEFSVDNLKILWVRPEVVRERLGRVLEERGAIVDHCMAYRTVPETDDVTGGRQRWVDEGADYVTFTSASTVESFVDLKLPWKAGAKVVSIGPVTSEMCRKHGLAVDLEAGESSLNGLMKTILEDVARHG